MAWNQPVRAMPEPELATAFDAQVRPFVQANFGSGSFVGSGGAVVRYRTRRIDNAAGALVVVNGRTEFSAKYDELLYDLRDLPVNFFSYDHRGQGMSDRLLRDANKGHVVRFCDYVFDLSIFIAKIVQKENPGPLIVVSHSMGGLVALLHANSQPASVQGMILCAPMLGINTAPLPAGAARLLAQGATVLGFAERYVPGGKPYDPNKSFSDNDVTHSEARFTLNKRLIADMPGLALGSPTFGWINQAFAGMDQLAADHRQLTMPVMLLQAEKDKVVQLAPQTAFCQSLPDCSLVPLPGAGHEILMERDAIRDAAIERIRAFVGGLIPARREESGRP